MKEQDQKSRSFFGFWLPLFCEIPPDCIDSELLLDVLCIYVLKNLLKIHGKTIATLEKLFGLNELIWATSVKYTLDIPFYWPAFPLHKTKLRPIFQKEFRRTFSCL